LKAYAKELGLSGAVRFLGYVSPIQAAIEGAAAVVVPSLGEGFGMVALEAMERARPVIASDVGGLPEIVADGETGFVVPAGDAEALADAMVALASDLPRAAAMGEAGRRRALESFTQERSTQGIEALYLRALETSS
jgi:glycosyltransferase involved in cell wall biosynthesis